MFGIKNKLGFGCMRLPMKNGAVDEKEFSAMIDFFIGSGFNYFDTAHGYLGGLSEKAIRKCLVDRYPRDSYILTDKLSTNYFEKTSDIRPFFFKQLEILGADRLDFYLMHAQDERIYEKYRRLGAYETALEIKAEGGFSHFGISFHDKAELLERILTDYPQIEVVQIQLNYLDWFDASVQSKKCWEVCRKFNKPVFVMEPVKGGSLAKLPEEAAAVFAALGNASPASRAIRFAAGIEGVAAVLSGMGSMAMIEDNVSQMKNFVPLSDAENAAIEKVRAIFKSMELVPCTACGYCTENCPAGVKIPQIFACLNSKNTFGGWNGAYYYSTATASGGRASDCLECGACEDICPQHLKIRKLLKQAKEVFEKQ